MCFSKLQYICIMYIYALYLYLVGVVDGREDA